MSTKNSSNYFSEFKTLNTFSKDFWVMNGAQFFEGLAYFSMINIMTVFLTQNCGFSDIDSNKWVGFYTLFVSAFVFAAGSVCDIIGIKKALYIGLGLHIISRIGIAVSSDLNGNCDFLWTTWTATELCVKSSILVMALGTAFVTPVIQAAIRRFSSKKARGTGFNLYYLIMNISAIIATSVVIDQFRDQMGILKGQVWVMNFGFIATFFAFICIFFVDENNYAEKEEAKQVSENKRPLKIFTEVWKEKPFQRLVLFLALSLGVRLVFTLQFLIFPKYYTRVLYDDFRLGFANAINPIIIVVGLLAIIPILNKYSTVKLMVSGMTISAFSMLLLVVPIEWYLFLPSINTLSDAFVFVVFAQIAIFAFGELLFSPRLTEYTASIAPKDKVTSYMSLSALPFYIAKPINGVLSGFLVAMFCYDGIRAKIDTANATYAESPQSMWMIYLILAILSPLSVLLFRKKLSGDSQSQGIADPEALEEAIETESTYLDQV